MPTPLACLLLFIVWTVLLLLAVGTARVWLVLTAGASPADFPAGVPHGSDRYWRLNRAHLNCLEFLPMFAAVVLTGAVLGVTEGTVATLAEVIVVARVGQSVTHISSGSAIAVNVRFTFFLVQLVSLIAMGVHIAGQA